MAKFPLSILIVGLLLVMLAACASEPRDIPLSPNASQSVILIRRTSEDRGDNKRMEIYIDGRADVKTIRNGQQRHILVSNGLHNIYVKLNKDQSQMLTIDCTSEVVEFMTHFEGRGRRAQLSLTRVSGGTGQKAAASNSAPAPVINIQVDNSSSNSASSSGNSSANTNSTTGTDNSVN